MFIKKNMLINKKINEKNNYINKIISKKQEKLIKKIDEFDEVKSIVNPRIVNIHYVELCDDDVYIKDSQSIEIIDLSDNDDYKKKMSTEETDILCDNDVYINKKTTEGNLGICNDGNIKKTPMEEVFELRDDDVYINEKRNRETKVKQFLKEHNKCIDKKMNNIEKSTNLLSVKNFNEDNLKKKQ